MPPSSPAFLPREGEPIRKLASSPLGPFGEGAKCRVRGPVGHSTARDLAEDGRRRLGGADSRPLSFRRPLHRAATKRRYNNREGNEKQKVGQKRIDGFGVGTWLLGHVRV